jgi:hypothetical protein
MLSTMEENQPDPRKIEVDILGRLIGDFPGFKGWEELDLNCKITAWKEWEINTRTLFK